MIPIIMIHYVPNADKLYFDAYYYSQQTVIHMIESYVPGEPNSFAFDHLPSTPPFCAGFPFQYHVTESRTDISTSENNRFSLYVSNDQCCVN